MLNLMTISPLRYSSDVWQQQRNKGDDSVMRAAPSAPDLGCWARRFQLKIQGRAQRLEHHGRIFIAYQQPRLLNAS